VAKLHIRHMVGGRAASLADEEIVYRFEFPERPGALLNFLNQMEHGWNIAMFHYRNHGAAYARVLVGFQVPRGERRALARFFADMARRHSIYSYWDETDNPAYRLFLR
jgi:threonine dehydratase